jgi:hypothetical protein
MTTKPTDGGTPATSAPQGGQNLPAHVYDQKAEMYKVAFEESVRALKDQVEELSAIRQRLVQYLAFVGAATAFLVGSGLHAVTRDGMFRALVSGGTALMLITIVCMIVLLWPTFSKFGATSSAQKIIYEMIEPKISPVRSEGELYHDLAIYNDQAADENETILKKARALYVAAIISGALQLTVWIVLVWLRG